MDGETYLGDGCYVSFDGYGLRLRAPQMDGDHWVYLEPAVYTELVEYVERLRKANAPIADGARAHLANSPICQPAELADSAKCQLTDADTPGKP